MSCIIAVKHENGYYIAADSKVSQGDYSINEMDYHHKIFKKKDMVFAVIGNTSFAQRIKHELIIKNVDKDFSFDEEYIYENIIPQLREFAEENAFSIFIAYKEKCFTIDTSLCVIEIKNYYTEGSGCSLAEGALDVLINIYDANKIDAIRQAYKIVINRIQTVGFPVCIYDSNSCKPIICIHDSNSCKHTEI